LQIRRLADLIAFARARSPFYSNLYGHLPADTKELHRLPPVSKHDLMQHFDDWVTDPRVTSAGVESFVSDSANVGGFYADQYAIWTSSGTTGTPGIFVQDQSALRTYAALALLRGLKVWVTPATLLTFLRQGLRAVFIIATGGHWASDAVKEHILGLSTALSDRILAYSVVEPIAQIVEKLNELRPTILVGYPSVLQLLAQQQISGALAISPLLIVSAAERLTPLACNQISGAFGTLVRELYAAAEFMGIAYSCDHGWLHLNHDWVILEPVNEAYEPVQPGQASHTVLLSNLANRVQPIIRYDLGDTITMKPDPCACGNPMPAIEVEGRTDDVLYLESTDDSLIPVPPMAFETVVELIPGVLHYQIIQTSPTRLNVRIDGSSQLGDEVVKHLHEYLATLGLQSIEIELSLESPMRDPVSGKYQHVRSEVG
jgi:putative adenylate-forming enzyme